ncbi:hypothetical protein WICPIJ_005287 [Wickerhamomyces pijperi]|uniref:NUDE domain-containing protein n=1 Tax=Wickerhamomyces pijperi TaxID=599730 RepID=A0A9P8Q460_WICPI|nr:hypothetical protein WICPIJ_005287 [Wickerhamomyces pijperi]
METSSVPLEQRYPNYESALATITQLEEELQEFQRSSYELESQLEDELQHLESSNKDLKQENDSLKLQVVNLKKEMVQAKQEEMQQRKDLNLKITSLEDKLIAIQTKLIETEIENDSIQQTERSQAALILELQTELQTQQEKTIILDAEVERLKSELVTVKLTNSNLLNQIHSSGGANGNENSDIRPQTLVLSTPIAQQHQQRNASTDSSSSSEEEYQSSILPKGREKKLSKPTTPYTPLAGKTKVLTETPSPNTPLGPPEVKHAKSKRHSSPVMAQLHNLIHRQPSQSSKPPKSITPSKQDPRTVSVGSSSSNYGGLILPKQRSTGQSTTKITNTNVLTASTHIKLDSMSNITTSNANGTSAKARRHSSINQTQHLKPSSPLSTSNTNYKQIIDSPISPSNINNKNNHQATSKLKTLQRRISSSKFLNWMGDSSTVSSPTSPAGSITNNRPSSSGNNSEKADTPTSKRFSRYSLQIDDR